MIAPFVNDGNAVGSSVKVDVSVAAMVMIGIGEFDCSGEFVGINVAIGADAVEVCSSAAWAVPAMAV